MGLIDLPERAVAYIDAQVVIYTVERHAAYKAVCEEIWDGVARGRISALTSQLTIMECAILPLRRKDHALLKRFDEFLHHPALQLVPVSEDVLKGAAKLRAGNLKLRTPDALHLATAETSRCTAIITNDARLAGCVTAPLVVLSDTLP